MSKQEGPAFEVVRTCEGCRHGVRPLPGRKQDGPQWHGPRMRCGAMWDHPIFENYTPDWCPVIRRALEEDDQPHVNKIVD